MRTLKMAFLLVLLVAVVGLVGFGKTYTIGFCPGIVTNPFYIAMQHGATQAANELGIELIWQGAQNWDFSEQTVILNALIARGVDALILAPTDPEAIKIPLQEAVDAGIAVITVDTDINDPDAEIRLTSIASDNVLGGFMAGEALAEAIGFEGEVALMGAMVGVTSNELRYEGFRAAIAQYPEIEIVASEYSQEDQAKAAQQMESVILAHPNLLGAFAVDTPTAHGCAVGVRNAGVEGEFVLVGFDAQPLEIEDLQAGLITMLVAQAPYAMGYVGVQLAYDYLQGFLPEFPGDFTTGFYVITADNVNDPQTQKWVYLTEPPTK